MLNFTRGKTTNRNWHYIHITYIMGVFKTFVRMLRHSQSYIFIYRPHSVFLHFLNYIKKYPLGLKVVGIDMIKNKLVGLWFGAQWKMAAWTSSSDTPEISFPPTAAISNTMGNIGWSLPFTKTNNWGEIFHKLSGHSHHPLHKLPHAPHCPPCLVSTLNWPLKPKAGWT